MEPNTACFCQYCELPTIEGASYCCAACETLDLHVRPIPLAPSTKNDFAYLDQQEFTELYRRTQSPDSDYTFYAEGLHCSSCVHLLEKLPEFYSEVKTARVNFAQSTVSVTLTDKGSLAQVAFVIQELGYRPRIISEADNLDESYKRENRKHLIQIAIAGFCAGNIMLFVIPVYSGLTGNWEKAFNWISFLLFLPILLYSALPFYQGAWNSLKYKVINVDLPITLALLTGFIFSTVNLVRGDGHIYFDSTASFIFLILIARYFLKRIQQNYLSPGQLQSFFQTEKYQRFSSEDSSVWETIPCSHVRVSDHLKVFAGQNIPADSKLLSERATLDLSLYNGESLPKVFTQGMSLFAGSKCLSSEIEIQIETSFKESRLGQILQTLDEGTRNKNKFISLTDELAKKLILVVFAIAILFFIFYASIDIHEAFNRSLALIVLACPCALAFGSPLTFGLAVRKAQRLGIFIKDSTSLEKLLKIKNVFFDKTGTLTRGDLNLTHSQPTEVPGALKDIILSLEASSYHPVAFALRQAWGGAGAPLEVENHKELLGRGVSGTIKSDHYELVSFGESAHDSELAVSLVKNGKSICRLYFSDSLRADSVESIQKIKALGLQCFVLSGDKKSRVLKASEACGISAQHTFAELYPEDKNEIIKSYPLSCMIGDGANDSLSLQTADVGIAVKGSVDLSLQSADIYFTRGGLSPFFELYNLSLQTRRTLVRNLTLSLLYNTIGGGLALFGFINPLLAAILMPLSSALIIASSLWGSR